MVNVRNVSTLMKNKNLKLYKMGYRKCEYKFFLVRFLFKAKKMTTFRASERRISLGLNSITLVNIAQEEHKVPALLLNKT
jgi:hypothetical protein